MQLLECLFSKNALTNKTYLVSGTEPASLLEGLASMRDRNVGGVNFKDLFTPKEIQTMLATVYHLRPEWQKGAGPGDYTVGNVWYSYIEYGEEDEYFDTASASNAYINEKFPGLTDKVLAFCRTLVPVGETVMIRPGWGGPAFVVFTTNCETALDRGVLHIDHDGQPEEFFGQSDSDTYSFIMPLQMPSKGGHLFVWPDIYDPKNRRKYLVGSGDVKDPNQPMKVIPHKVGKLVAIKSMRVHQIDKFPSQMDRITLNFRLTKEGDNWVVWF